MTDSWTQLVSLDTDELSKFFANFQASLVVLNSADGRSFEYNSDLCRKPLSPCSTFKIFNALIGLEIGVLEDENTSMSWDGTKYDIDSWNQDQTLQTAVRNSAVWYFQRVAEAIGKEPMQEYLDKIDYGNRDISGGLTTFWLGSTLTISAYQQVSLLKDLLQFRLPFSQRSMLIVKNVIKVEQTERGVLYGKTGSLRDGDTNSLGWFVGAVEQPHATYAFALNIQAPQGAWGPKAREIAQLILYHCQLL